MSDKKFIYQILKRKRQLIAIFMILAGVFTTDPNQINANLTPAPTDKRISCLSSPDMWNGLTYNCSEKEIVVPATGDTIKIDAGGQGAIAVRGGSQNEITIRIISEVWGNSDEENQKTLKSIGYRLEKGKLAGTFSLAEKYELPWGVSFELLVPAKYNVTATTANGAIYIDRLTGNIETQSTNGAIYLTEVGGRVSGNSVNGRIEARIEGREWSGELLDVSTANGDIAVYLPENYSAELDSKTEQGKIFIENQTDADNSYKKNLNAGGQPIIARSENGNILFVTQK